MYQQKIAEYDAIPFDQTGTDLDQGAGDASLATRIMALLIIAALPFLLVWLVVRFVWSDVKLIGRGIRFAFQVLTEELSRKS